MSPEETKAPSNSLKKPENGNYFLHDDTVAFVLLAHRGARDAGLLHLAAALLELFETLARFRKVLG